MSVQQPGQRSRSSSRTLKALASLLVAGTSCFALVWPAQSQLASHQVSAPSIAVKSTDGTTSHEHSAPVQAEMPAPPPIKLFPGFEEGVVATGPITDAETNDLDAALKAFHDAPLSAAKGNDYSDYAQPLLAYIAAHPKSNWNTGLYLNLGLGYYHAGYYSKAFDAYGKAWEAGKGAEGYQAHLMVDRALGELAMMHSRVGHEKELGDLLGEVVNKRPMGGPGAIQVRNAREAMWVFHHDQGSAYLCGPQALRTVLITLKAKPKQIKILGDARSGPHGFSLTELAQLADKVGFKYKLIKREPGQPVPVPSVINWNVHHYAAVTGITADGKYIVQDPTFGDSAREMSQKAIDAEGSGYFLVPAKMAAINTSGWRIVDPKSQEAHDTYGMGQCYAGTPGNTTTVNCPTCTLNNKDLGPVLDDRNAQAGQPPLATAARAQMSAANVTAGNANLHIDDTPVGYKPQVGPSAKVSVFYNAQEALQPATFSFSNLSPAWSHSWMAYIYDDPTSATGGLPQRQAGGGGGWQLGSGYFNYGSYCGYTPELPGYTQMLRYPCSGAATKYVLMLKDGSQQVYSTFNGATTYPRTIFMTQFIDPQGNATTLNYDASFRLTSTTDAMGRSTTYTYGLTSYPLLITKITDPFSRFTSMTYDTSQRLSTVTDPVGITSTYNYSATQPTFISSLVTPYGTTTFNNTVNPNDPVETNQRSLVTTDPLGYSDFTYFFQQAPGISASDPAATVPSGPCTATTNSLLQWRNVFYWDKHAFTGNVTLNGSGVPISETLSAATIFHFVHNDLLAPGGNPNYYSYDAPESIKKPLENRVWTDYYNAPTSYYVGIADMLAGLSRVLDDGTTQNHCWTHTSGQVNVSTDEMGRKTQYNWNTNTIDLASVQQNTASGYSTIASYGTYSSQHRPASYTDAAGQIWNYTYTTLGQLKTEKDPLGNTTTYNHDTSNRLSTIVDANSNTVLTLTYDSADRVLTRTDSQGYVLTYAYDNLDRVTKITYPDGTTDLYDYTFQSGPLMGTESQELRKHTDRLGRVTTYAYDADQRLTSVVEPTSGSATRTTQYKYYENGVLEDIIDANGNDTHWNIDIQSRPVSKTYQYGTASATTETYIYENTTSRLHSITDALGQVKTFTYDHANEITGITYTSTVNPTPNVTLTWDSYWPRLTSMTDGTGTTNYGYTAVGTNGALKISSVTSPYTNGTISLTYDADGRLSDRTIPGGNETFGYDTINRLNSHVTPLGSFTLGYLGESDQLTSQSVTNGSVTVSTGWGYDTNTNDRRLISITNSGVTRSYTMSYLNGTTQNPYDIQKITDTAATGHPWATQSRNYTYDLIDRLLTASSTTPGNDTYAYDKLDNATTYNIPGTSTSPTYNGFNQIHTWGTKTYAYDANGNLTSGDGVKTYKYDAENRLIEIDYIGTSNKSVFMYDGIGHRISDAETVSGTTTTTYYLWCSSTICQTRNSSQTVVRRDLPEGEYNVSTSQKLIYMPDKLGSVRDVIDGTTGSLVASYDFMPYGAVARSNVTNGADFQYAGLFAHAQSGLNLAALRALDGTTGRWTNRDPIKESGGVNLYGFVGANPVMRLDPTGLTWEQTLRMTHQWANGTAPPLQWFGPNTKQTQDMQNAPGVQDALLFWQNKNSAAGTCACGQQHSVTGYDVSFGLSGYINAGSNPTQQFVGSYSVDIYPDQHGNVEVMVKNTTSLTSFFAQLWPDSWNPPAGQLYGNYTQYYTWTQPLSCQ